MQDDSHNISAHDGDDVGAVKKPWERPEIVTFKPVDEAEGISYQPNDGISNLTLN